jgi:N-acylneuraminate cytidylyltransferase
VSARVVAVVPARGGSKGVPRKNLREVGGASLVHRAVAVGLETADEVIVSSDDTEILDEGRRAGARTDERPARLADDEARVEPVLLDLLDRVECDVVVVLQPTSPLREAGDVRACIAALDKGSSAATVMPTSHPVEWTFTTDGDGTLVPVLGWDALVGRRQDAAPTYQLNGAVYACTTDHLRSGARLVDRGTIAVVMPAERSLDVDTEHDLVLADLLLRQRY